MGGVSDRADGRTARFERKRAQILDAASDEINQNGVCGLTLTAVARALALDTSSVTYYFRFKEDLAAACIGRSVEQLRARADAARADPSPGDRVRRFIAGVIEMVHGQTDPRLPRLALLSDMRALEDEVRAPLDAAYREAFHMARGYFDDATPPASMTTRTIAAHLLFANVHWMPAWVGRYYAGDLARAAERLSGLLLDGLQTRDPWPLDLEPLEPAGEPEPPQTRFLHAATKLINRHGYKGASVEKIAAELGVSVGSFYHHLDGKDELVVACFNRSFQIVERAQARAQAIGGSRGAVLGAIATLLLAFQFSAESPLLRTSAFQALGSDLRAKMFDQTRAFTLHLQGLIADGIAEGSIRPVDPLIASHLLVAVIYGASEMRPWASRRPLPDAVAACAGALRQGLAHAAQSDQTR